MASKNYTELQAMSIEELENELVETKTQYHKLKFDHAVKGLENPLRLRQGRKLIARLATELRKRELESLNPEQLKKRNRIVERRK